MSESIDPRVERERKLQTLKVAGLNPYPARTARTHEISAVITNFDTLLASAQTFIVSGRIMAFRGHGALVFLDLFDGTEKIQIFVSKEVVGEDQFSLLQSTISTGDFVEITGTAYITQRGVQAVKAASWIVLTKALTTIPTEHFGIKDEDERYRKRYLDILLNPEVRDIVYKRSKFWQTIRTFLIGRGFVEVETPVLETTAGGAEARPFVTHHNALDIDVYLRISAGELWQKKLMVAGIPKTFEIGRIFRNEGMSAEHLQDYTQLEFYEAYSDYEKGMQIIKELYLTIAHEVFNTTKFTIKGHEVDLASEWKIYNFSEIIEERFGINPVTEVSTKTGKPVTADELKEICAKAGVAYEDGESGFSRVADNLWKTVRKEIAGPGYLVGIPVSMEPLAKRSVTNPDVVERFQVILAGSEMGKGFSELNDPVDQKERFLKQQALRDAGDEEAQMADMDYVEAMEYGMPPTFGFGLSERLFSFLMDKPARETQIFPLMRPKDKGGEV
jgi:lysyl-tRNA synthetase class 2